MIHIVKNPDNLENWYETDMDIHFFYFMLKLFHKHHLYFCNFRVCKVISEGIDGEWLVFSVMVRVDKIWEEMGNWRWSGEIW